MLDLSRGIAVRFRNRCAFQGLLGRDARGCHTRLRAGSPNYNAICREGVATLTMRDEFQW